MSRPEPAGRAGGTSDGPEKDRFPLWRVANFLFGGLGLTLLFAARDIVRQQVLSNSQWLPYALTIGGLGWLLSTFALSLATRFHIAKRAFFASYLVGILLMTIGALTAGPAGSVTGPPPSPGPTTAGSHTPSPNPTSNTPTPSLSPGPATPQPLMKLNMTGGDPPSNKGLAVLGGHQVDNSLSYSFAQSCCGGATTETVFDLSANFRTLESTIGLEDGSTFQVRFKVVSNDTVVYDKTVAPGQTFSVKVDISGANSLHLQMVTIDTGELPLTKRATAIWGNATVS